MSLIGSEPRSQAKAVIGDNSAGRYGVLRPIQSTGELRDRVYTDLKDLANKIGQSVWVRARLQTSSCSGHEWSAVLRQSRVSVQLVFTLDDRVSRQLIEFAATITKESLVDVHATVKKASAPAAACTVYGVELIGDGVGVELIGDGVGGAELWTVSASRELPFTLDSAGPELDNPIELETLLDHRVLHLRTPVNQAIFRIKAGVCRLFYESLVSKGFINTHTPRTYKGRLSPSEEIFPLPYFGSTAYLTHAIAYHQQLAIMGDFEKVCSVGPLFRREKSMDNRHLTEFWGLNLAMTIKHHYHEAMDTFVQTFNDIFRGLKEQYASDIAIVGRQFKVDPFKFLETPPRLEYPEAIQMLRDAGVTIGDLDELSVSHELILGRLVREKYDADFFVLDKFPAALVNYRAMPDPHNPVYANACDMYMRGVEVFSGSQRISEYDLLVENAVKKGIDIDINSYFFDAFKYGCPPHAGGGMGLERVVTQYLGLGDVHLAAIFPRDARRLAP